jgi:hypothetical protein
MSKFTIFEELVLRALALLLASMVTQNSKDVEKGIEKWTYDIEKEIGLRYD